MAGFDIRRNVIGIGIGGVIALCMAPSIAYTADGTTAEQAGSGLQFAEKLRKEGNFSSAESIYRELTKHDDTAVPAYMGLAAMYRKTGHPQDAVKMLRDAQAREPGNTKMLLALGQSLIAAGQPEEAVNVLDTLSAMEPGNANAYSTKAVAFDHAGNHVAAQEIYQKALSLAPGSSSIRNNIAMSYILSGQVDDAITVLEPLSLQEDASATIRQNLALAYGLKGDRKRALELGMKDVSEKEAQDNLRFYEAYARKQKASQKAERMVPPAIVDAGPQENMPVAKMAPAAGKPAVAQKAPMAASQRAPMADDDEDVELDAPAEVPGTFLGVTSVPDYPANRK